MNNFNFNRFSQALKCHFMVTRKTWIRLFGIYTLVLFMANLFFTRVQGFAYSHMVEHFTTDELIRTYGQHVHQTAYFGIIFFCIAMLFFASFLFSQMKDTRSRSAYLLWPVSHLEKYVISLLHSIVLAAVLTIAAYVLADALRVFVDWVTGRIIIWGVPKLIYTISHNSAFDGWRMIWMTLAWMLYFHSLYIVGGTLFRRHQFLMTSGTILVTAILLTTIVNQITWSGGGFNFITSTWDEKTLTYTQTFYPAFYIINTVVSLLVVFHYWASYKLFTRMQVINNKWLNV